MPKRDGLRADLRSKMDMEESVPGWQDRVLERTQYGSRQGASKSPYIKAKKRFGNDLHFHAGPKLKALVNLAAEKRGVSRATYFRRALAAFIAHDLDITQEEVLSDGPNANEWGKTGGDPRRAPGDDLSGFGPWRLDGLHE